MITPEQSRAARAWLDWSQDDLATKAKVSPSTIRDFEKGRRKPIGNNMDAIQRVFDDAGVRFMFADDGAATGIVGPVTAR
jgi:ribosome-binding protein aMBF1 (putative translation factor)